MIGYVRSLLIIICLHLPILWTRKTKLELAGPDREPVLSDVDVLQILTEEAGSTFTVICVPDEVVPDKIVPDKVVQKDEMSRAKRAAASGFDLVMRCGAGKKCSSDMCGP